MSGILFNKDGATKDKIITKDELYLVIKALKLEKYVDKLNDNTFDDSVETKLIELFEEIHQHASKQDDRSIHIVVAEPVEYDYDDYI